LLFLDEPTSGLDAYTAEVIIDCLKTLAKKEKKTIIFTIHQPSSQIFEKFDNLMLLSKGEMVYWGPAQESSKYFDSIGHPVPALNNPADYYSNL
jgi:ABC-type multidrug transport system ATPase subunit